MQPKVLYIVGKGRSGSTLLDTMLGQFQGHVAVGEAWHFWELADDPERLCGCGLRLGNCPRWAGVRRRLEASDVDYNAARTAVNRATSWPTVLAAAISPRLVTRRLREYARFERNLYEAIAEEFDATVIVDSSKWPTDPLLLGLVDGFDPIAIHLLRDPRGVTYSWRRQKAQTDRTVAEDMPRHPPAQSALSWLVRNVIAEIVIGRMTPGQHVQIRYEDLVSDPGTVLASISEMTGVVAPSGLFPSPTQLRIRPTHTVAGNPDRIHAGVIELRLDRTWQSRLGWMQRGITTAIAFPLLRRYGYRVLGASTSESGR